MSIYTNLASLTQRSAISSPASSQGAFSQSLASGTPSAAASKSAANASAGTGSAAQNAAHRAFSILNSLPPALTQFATGRRAYDKKNAAPTVGQFMLAAFESMINPETPPPSLTNFAPNGKQMKTLDVSNGLFGEVWETPAHQLIISYAGTAPVWPWGAPMFKAIVKNDIALAQGLPFKGREQALAFAKDVQRAAAAKGIDPQKDVFVTGVSHGGYLAEYVAQNTGLSGMGIVSPGLAKASGKTVGDGSNFINVLVHGDPVSQLDERFGTEPAAITNGKQHYGANAHIGLNVMNFIEKTLAQRTVGMAPAGENTAAYAANALLAPIGLVFGDSSMNRYLDPITSPAALAGLAFLHAAGAIPNLVFNANLSLPEFIQSKKN